MNQLETIMEAVLSLAEMAVAPPLKTAGSLTMIRISMAEQLDFMADQ